MESVLQHESWGWRYTSKRGTEYTVGEITKDFNVIVDEFEDINEMFDYEALVQSRPITYVYGDLVRDNKEIKEWLDDFIDRYERHERTVRFYTNILNRSDVDVLYECYIGTEEKMDVKTTVITMDQLYKIAKEIRGEC